MSGSDSGKDDSDKSYSGSEEELAGYRLSRASERERIYLDYENPEESYIMLYTEEYLSDDDVWRRRYYPQHLPEKLEEDPAGEEDQQCQGK